MLETLGAHGLDEVGIEAGVQGAALILGLLNAIVRPILFLLTLPLTIVTLGLFLIVLNAVMLELTAWLVPGFHIDSFGWAIVGAIVLTLVSLVTNRIGEAASERR